jgi:hypothetical protein
MTRAMFHILYLSLDRSVTFFFWRDTSVSDRIQIGSYLNPIDTENSFSRSVE